jgi:hypothetical protein
LLQGIVHCSRCGRRMSVIYESRRSAFYQCRQQTSLGKYVYCYMVSAPRVDAWVAERILEAVRPLGIEAALAAIDELERRSEEIRKQWDQRIEQAGYEASLARRRYEQVDPLCGPRRNVASRLHPCLTAAEEVFERHITLRIRATAGMPSTRGPLATASSRESRLFHSGPEPLPSSPGRSPHRWWSYRSTRGRAMPESY